MKRPPFRSIRNRGFYLIELMFVLGLLAVAATIGSRLFLTLTRTTGRVAREERRQAAFDHAVRGLRADVWTAWALNLRGPDELEIHEPDGRTILWSAGERLGRTAGRDVQHWNDPGARLDFEVRGPTLILLQRAAPGDIGGRMVLPSQRMLLQEAGR